MREDMKASVCELGKIKNRLKVMHAETGIGRGAALNELLTEAERESLLNHETIEEAKLKQDDIQNRVLMIKLLVQEYTFSKEGLRHRIIDFASSELQSGVRYEKLVEGIKDVFEDVKN